MAVRVAELLAEIDRHQAGREKGYKGEDPQAVKAKEEAEVNLRVALFLRQYLETAGAEVFMTRTEDAPLHTDENEDLRRRAEVANSPNCSSPRRASSMAARSTQPRGKTSGKDQC
jgi:N-acetylmuramoyl-L-alanine amidase